MIRSSRGKLADDFESNGVVAIGYGISENLSRFHDLENLREYLKSLDIAANPAGQISRFVCEIQPGDNIITYDSAARQYLLGIAGEYFYNEGIFENLRQFRKVQWIHRIDRDNLSKRAKGCLGSLLTVFSLAPEVKEEIHRLADGAPPSK